MRTTRETTRVETTGPVDPDARLMPPPAFRPRRRRWPGVLAAMLIGGAVAAALVSSYYDDRTIGQKIDATVDAAQSTVERKVGTDVPTALDDAGITAKVKTALAADPSLSAARIDVTTHDGVVSLKGPAPDEKARERASVLAAAPEGVKSVDNQLEVRTN